MTDLIDRNALREAMYDEAFEKDSNEQMWDGGCWIRYRMFERIVESMPAQPAQKKGKWIDIDSETYMWMIKCDQCGHLRSMMSTEGIYPKFCENCGADMRGE